MILYDYFRSTASYRVRIALHLKNIPYEKREIHLVNHGGEHSSAQYKQINPQGLVPSLDVGKGHVLNQSLAIIDYLESCYPNPALLPQDPLIKATIKTLALTIACDMHPLNNLRVLNQLKQQFQADDEQIRLWYHHWLKAGFDAFEEHLKPLERTTPVCYGDQVSLADVCLIPQVYNAHRFKFSMKDYPLINQISEYCLKLVAFKKAAPES